MVSFFGSNVGIQYNQYNLSFNECCYSVKSLFKVETRQVECLNAAKSDPVVLK